MLTTILACLLLILVLCRLYVKLYSGRCYSNVSLVGKTCLITGGVSGLGFETALKLAARGCEVVIADIVNGDKSVRRIIEESGNPNVSFKYLDVGDFECVREFCKEFLKDKKRLDILINNAGISNNDGVNADGNLKIMSVNFYGHFLLTHLLISLIKKTKNSRVLFTSSKLAFYHGLKDVNCLNHLNEKNRYQRSLKLYGNSKLCMIITSNLMSKKGIHANSVHPGLVNTNINWNTFNYCSENILGTLFVAPAVALYIFLLSKTINDGAETLLDAAISKNWDGRSGLFFCDCKPSAQPQITKDLEFCKAIWEETEKIVGLKEDEKLN